MKYLALILALAAIAWPVVADARETAINPEIAIPVRLENAVGMTVRIRTGGGGDFRGELHAIGPDRVEILDSDGRIIAIATAEILTAEIEKHGASYFQDAAENRLIVMPTAFGMDAGEFHVTNQELLAFEASYGIGERITVWGAISIPGALVNAKACLPLKGFGGAALGSFAGYAWLGKAWAFLPYTIVSLGNPERNLDAGAGVILVRAPDVSVSPYWIATLAGKAPVSRTTALVGEAWIVVGEEIQGKDPLQVSAVPMGVFRIASSRMSWDIGAAFPFVWRARGGRVTGLMDGDFVPLPLVSLTYRVR
jgi:hypothetical protein